MDMREVINAILSVLRAGCAWRLLPHDFPAWQTVYVYFRLWRKTTLFTQINTTLREQGARFSWGRAGIATKMRYAFGTPHQGFQRRPIPDAMPQQQHTRR